MTDEGVKAVRNALILELVKGILIGGGVFVVVRIVIPYLVDRRDDTLLAVAVVVGLATLLAVIWLLFDSVIVFRKLNRKFHFLAKENEQ